MKRQLSWSWLAGLGLAAVLLVFTFGLIGPFRAEAARKRGLEFARQGRWAEARHQLDQALSLDQGDADALRARARVLSRLEDTDAALLDLRRARDLTPKDAGLRAEEIDLLVAAGRTDEALDRVAAARRDLPASGHDLDLGLAFVRTHAAVGALHEAVADVDVLLEAHGRSHQAHHLKGQLCRRLGEEARARASFAEAVTLAPGIARYRRALDQEHPGLPR